MGRRKKSRKAEAARKETGAWKYVANAVIVAVISIFLYDIFNYDEHWPFSSHRMYSTINGPTYVKNELMLVTADGEVTPDVDLYFKPFKKSRFNYMLRNLIRSGNKRLAREALDNMATIYEKNKEASDDQWPELVGLRLYQLSWELDPSLANRDNPRKSLMFEYRF